MRYVRLAVGLGMSAIALYVAFAGIDWPDVKAALSEADYWLLAAALPLLLVYIGMRAQRWRLLFQPDREVPLRSTFGALNVGFLAGGVLPLQLGELVRVYVLGEVESIGKARVLSTVAVERLFDIFVLLVLLAVLLPFIELPAAAAVTAGIFVGAFVVGTLVVVLLLMRRTQFERWLSAHARLLPASARGPALDLARSLLDGLTALRDPRLLLAVTGWTAVSWLTSASVIYLLLRAFSLDVPVAAAPFLLIATTFGFFIPSSPGAVGVYHAISVRALMSVFAVAHEPAASYAIVAHAFYLIPPMIIGSGFAWWYQLGLRALARSADQPAAAPQETAPVLTPNAEPEVARLGRADIVAPGS